MVLPQDFHIDVVLVCLSFGSHKKVLVSLGVLYGSGRWMYMFLFDLSSREKSIKPKCVYIYI